MKTTYINNKKLITEINDSVFLDLKVNREIDWSKANKIEVKYIGGVCESWVSQDQCTNPDCGGYFSHSQVGLR